MALWFGVWGCIAGYLSCVSMSLHIGLTLPFALVWSPADFFEGFIPLVAYRGLKVEQTFQLEHPRVAYALVALLVVNIIVSAVVAVPNSNRGLHRHVRSWHSNPNSTSNC